MYPIDSGNVKACSSMSNEVFDGQTLAEKLSKLNNSQQSIECILDMVFQLSHIWLQYCLCSDVCWILIDYSTKVAIVS